MKNSIINKLVKKDNNDKLEEILSNKNFSEEIKNVLLGMFYKIENGYLDYKMVKRDTFDKEEYILRLTKIIDKSCNNITFLKNNKKKMQYVDKVQKEIICLPTEINILYCLSEIQKDDIIVNFVDDVINESLSYVLNIGNNINFQEPLRDFNGFSWNTIKKDIESIECNLIYQNILFFVSNEWLDKWINSYEPLVDYFDLFQNKLEKKYGKNLKNSIIEKIIKLSILIKCSQDDIYKQKIIEKRIKIQKENEKFENKTMYLTEMSAFKKIKEKEIKKIDEILNDKELLLEEYEIRNKNLPLDKKIFSVRVLKKLINDERKEIVNQIKEINNAMMPGNFLNNKQIMEQKINLICNYKLDNINNDIKNGLIELQKDFIKCMYNDLKNTLDIKEYINLIYLYRYFCFLPIDSKTEVINEVRLKDDFDALFKYIIKKAIDLKIINKIAIDESKNIEIMKNLFLTKIISLEDIYIKLVSDDINVNLIVYDEDVEDFKIIIPDMFKDDFNIKFNKKVRIFI